MKSYHDIVGDGGSGIAEQVGAQRRRLASSLAGVRHRVAIASGKGGVGKSTLALQLATGLAERGRRAAVFDADLNGPSQARLAGLPATPFVPGARGVALPRGRHGVGVVSLGSVVPEGSELTFEAAREGDSHVWRATREFTAAGELLGAVDWGRLDLLLFDLPPGAERTFQWAEFLGPQTAFVLVTLPSALSRGVVARSVAALRRAGNPLLGYVENMAGYHCDGCDAVRPLFPETAERDLGLPCLGRIPFDPLLAQASDRGSGPLEDAKRPAVRALRRLAERLDQVLEQAR